MIFEGHQTTERIFYVAEGWVAIHKSMPDGRRHVLGFRCAGEHFCALTDRDPAASTAAECLTPCRIGAAPAHWLNEDDGARRLTLSIMQAELRAAYEGLANLGGRSVRERFAFLLLNLVRRVQAHNAAPARCIHLPISQLHLAEALGVTNVYLNRVLKDLRDRNILQWGRSGVDVLDIDSLARLTKA